MTTERELLLQFLASLTLCENMGDVADTMDEVIKRMGLGIEWDDPHDLARALHARGVTTLWGTSLDADE